MSASLALWRYCKILRRPVRKVEELWGALYTFQSLINPLLELHMTLLALGAGIFFALAIMVREFQLARERALHAAVQEQLRLALEGTRAQLRRTAEDLFVLQTVMVERHLLDEAELARSRARLIETPRRIAEERDAIQRNLGLHTTHLVIDEGEGKIH